MTRGVQIALAGLAIALLIGCDLAMAQANLHDASRTFSGLLELIRNNSYQWSGRLRDYAVSLFWILAAIQLVWTFFPLVLRQAELGEILGELVRFIMIIGFFAALLMYSVQWAEAIVNSFRQAGAQAAGVGVQLQPGDMFGMAVELAKTIGDMETWNPLVATMVAIAAIIVLLCYAFIAAFMGLTLVESFIVINASVLFMGFGGSQWTREYAISMMRYALAVGAKLFVLTLIVGLIMESARDWQRAYNHDETSMWTMVGLALICAYLSKTIPDLIQALISGTSSSGGAILGGMAAAGMAGAAAAMATMSSTVGSSGLLGGAGKSVSDLLMSGSGSGSPGGPSMNSMKGSGGSASAGPSPRVGGGSRSGPAPGPAPAPGSTPGTASGSTSKGASAATMAHMATSGAVRTVGTLASMAVPGMEGSESLSVGPPPSPPDSSLFESLGETPNNIIRPAPAPVAEAPAVIDTLSSLQEALNNRG